MVESGRVLRETREPLGHGPTPRRLTEAEVEALHEAALVQFRCSGCYRDWWERKADALVQEWGGPHLCPHCGAPGHPVGYRFCSLCEESEETRQAALRDDDDGDADG